MTKAEIRIWLRTSYPTTIVNDRYGGTYSNARWLAFPTYADDTPLDWDAEDMECQYFWDTFEKKGGIVGKGATPDEAFADLKAKLTELKNDVI